MIASVLASRYRQIAQFHENERLIAWLAAQRWLVWLTPERRKFVLVIGAIGAGLIGTFHRFNTRRDAAGATAWLVCALAFLILLAIVYSLYQVAVHYKRLPSIIRGRPQICFHLLFWLLLLAIWSAPDNSGLGWLVITVVALSFPYLIWRCGYMLLSGQRGKAAGTGFGDHLFYIWPVWDGTNTPPGKGHDHLSRSVAQTPEAYARAVLGGIKLLLLVGLWTLVMQLIGALIYADPKSRLTPVFQGHSLGLPRLKHIFASGAAFPLPVIWISLYLELIWEALYIAAKGHVWIGVLRLYGFNVFRNTYKPLLAESVVEFWNRYYYYFKELMMEFFFYPPTRVIFVVIRGCAWSRPCSPPPSSATCTIISCRQKSRLSGPIGISSGRCSAPALSIVSCWQAASRYPCCASKPDAASRERQRFCERAVCTACAAWRASGRFSR